MSNILQKPSPCETSSTVRKFRVLWSKQKAKLPTLPPLQQAGGGGYNKSKLKTFMLHRKPTTAGTRPLRNPVDPFAREMADAGKIQAQIRLTRAMLRNRRATLQELGNQERFLAKLNDELLRMIRDVEDSTALTVRELLHQQDTLASVVNILEYSNKRRLQQLKSEIQEWEETENQKMSCLERQVQHLDAQNKKTQDQVNFLSTYMDHEYPVKLVQLASLGRQVQQAKDRQQDELDDFSELRRKVLASVCAKIQEKKRRILRAVAVKTQRPHQEALLRKMQESQFMQKFAWRFRDFIGQLEEELPVLRQEVGALQAQVWDPREVVFADVLLRRPKCTPDMDVLINIPMEEPLPF
ncbi:uncharacterized protein C20orf96 homolog isoform X3 [Lepus europaeus]|uniref:uncharacterized protein C20orf96 homolog isoform X3 n=1 Tax=Lepus europaeus TaxID=9983 RepID=UPI002B4A32E5|nr:uncharacterized protein C20orf96 homolog isoform X3 [Lepus europaeus]